MKKFIAAGLLLTSLIAGPVLAAQVVKQDVAKVESGKTIDDDLYVSGETVIIDGTVNGDVFAAAESVTINGTVNGDVYAFAGHVTVNGTVRDDLVTATQKLQLSSGKVGDSVIAAAESVVTEADSSIGGGLIFAASDSDIRSKVGRGITGAGDKVNLGSESGKGAWLAAGTLTLNSGTKINGDLNYMSDNDLIKNQGSEVTGQTKRTEGGRNKAAQTGVAWGYVVWSLISSAIVGLILIRVMPTAVPGIAAAIRARPWASLGWGLLIFLLSLPVIILMLVSIIGIPLAILSGIAFGTLIYLSKLFVSLSLGNLLADRGNWKMNIYWIFLIGLIVLTVVGLLPILGGFVKMITLLLGFGGVALYVRDRLKVQPKPA